MKRLRLLPLLFLLLPFSAALLAMCCYAQDAPSHFWTRQQIVAQSMNAAARAADVAQTCYHLRNGWREAWEPSQSCTGVAMWTFSGVPASIGTSYLLHRRGHERMARWTPYLFTAGSVAAIAFTYSHHPCISVPSSREATYNCN